MQFNRNKLAIARKRNKLSKKSLAEQVGLTPLTITRLERGDNQPEEDTVHDIARALGFPPDFFYDSNYDCLPLEQANFRSLSTLSARERDAALAAGDIAFMVSNWLDEKFNLPTLDVLDLSVDYSPEAAAMALREYWNLGQKPIKNMVQLLESKGIKVFILSEDTQKVDAFSCWKEKVPFVFLNTLKTAERSRFDAAHELGHLVLHQRAHKHTRQPIEREADAFASTFLMPEDDFVSKVRYCNTLQSAIKLKSRWKVSAAALAYRAHKLGITTDWHYRSICIELNKHYGKSEPRPIEREQSAVWSYVLQELWKEKITKEKISHQLNIPTSELEGLIGFCSFDAAMQVNSSQEKDKREGLGGLRLVN